MNTSETMMYEWNALNWRKLEQDTFKLQKRIYRASRQGDVRKVHQLQKLLIKSQGSALLAVRRVTQENRGKGTAGIDGLASLDDREKLDLARQIMREPLVPVAQPVRRVWIPKPDKQEKRPLGIPVMADRARQALAKMALEPEWEAKFEPNSYGFRPGRSCHDAIEAIFASIQQAPKYVLDADIAKCFDRINHEALLTKLGTFPSLRRAIRAWLKAGVMDGAELFPTTEGTPQGGVISPLLANIALHGIEKVLEDAFSKYKRLPSGRQMRWTPRVIRYADDFVVLHRDRAVIERCKEILAAWLAGMGLEMKLSKTRITHTLDSVDGVPGFDFLGFNVRHYDRGPGRGICIGTGEKLDCTPSIRPSAPSQKRLLQKIRDILHAKRSWPPEAVVAAINPVLKGWGNYFSTVVSKDIFHRMDHLVYWKLWPWAKRRHSNKSSDWVYHTYWVRDGRRWTFGVKGAAKLFIMGRIPIERHVKVLGDRSPFDGDAIYWGTRMGRHPELRWSHAMLLKRQKGQCPCCGLFFKYGDQLVIKRTHCDGEVLTPEISAVVHDHCQHVVGQQVCLTTHQSAEEPDEGKLSRPVLKTSMDSDVHA